MYEIGNVCRLRHAGWKENIIQQDVEVIITNINLTEEYPYRVKSLNPYEPLLETPLMNIYSVNTKEEGLIYVRSK